LIITMEGGQSYAVEADDASGLDEDLNTAVDLAPLASVPAVPGISEVGLQAQEIIASILEDPTPGLAEVKLRLRRCLAAHPGFPERALLAHLMEISDQVNAADEAPDGDVGPDRGPRA
jgi:hypothetical protein